MLAALHELYPDAPIFTLFHDPERTHPSFQTAEIHTSTLQRIPFVRGREEWLLPFMPIAVEHLDLSKFDLVISSASSFAKGVIVAPHAKHISYVHTPARFLWEDRKSYVRDLSQPRIVKRILPFTLHRLRMWDRLAADRPDVMVTNSETSRRRISRYYNRDAQVIYPPVDIEDFASRESFVVSPDDPRRTTRDGRPYWLTGGRLVGYKRFDLTVQAFAKLNLPLKVFGTGPELVRLKRHAGPETTFLGRVSEEEKRMLYADCIGFIHPQIEDFGITAVEAMAMGKPVLAFGQGGASETVIDGVTGRLFEAQTWADIGDAVIRFDPSRYDPVAIRAHAQSFSKDRFKERFGRLVQELITA